MDFYIVIPAYNEEAYLEQTLQSLTEQTLVPKRIVVVDDTSTDGTLDIAQSFSEKYPFITAVQNTSEAKHLPGSKVVKAFYKGLETLDQDYDVLCKFDADLIFPKDYLSRVAHIFEENAKCGMAGGFCYIQKNGEWQLESLTNKDHIRGALKAYRKKCFEQIGGLKLAMGWDTVDELLAQYHHWEVTTDTDLHVKHLKPTGQNYAGVAGKKQGAAFKKMRYGLVLTVIAAGKLALKKGQPRFFFSTLSGFLNTKGEYLVTLQEGHFIRKLRWRRILNKLSGSS